MGASTGSDLLGATVISDNFAALAGSIMDPLHTHVNSAV